jgi:SPP1 gp7 family putative phage head morphogenesis protein
MRERSFWIAGIENDAILERVQNALIESIAKGETWEDFKKRAERIFEELKAAPLQLHRLQNVFRTNLFSSYAKAQIEQLQSMQERFPLWRYVAILDGATRPQHRAWNGTIWRIGEGPYPPLRNGEDGGISFNCRCSAQHIHLYEAERLEANKSLKIESGEPFSLQQILTDERAAFQRYIADVRAHLNDKIHDHIQHSI